MPHGSRPSRKWPCHASLGTHPQRMPRVRWSMVVRLSNLRQAPGSHLERQGSSLLKLPPEVACKACLGRLFFWFLVQNRWFCGCLDFHFLLSTFCLLFSNFTFLISICPCRMRHTPVRVWGF